MTKEYRHPYSRSKRPSLTERPPVPGWLAKGLDAHVKAGKNGHSFRYWLRMYWATPPWLTDEHVQQIKSLHLQAPAGYEVDHIVPLSSTIVCGLNVPWNLTVRPRQENQHKSNAWWPDAPMTLMDMFSPHRHEVFELAPPSTARRQAKKRRDQPASPPYYTNRQMALFDRSVSAGPAGAILK